MFLFLFPYVTFQTKYVSSLGYQSLYISGTETIQFDLNSFSGTSVVTFSKSSYWRTTSGSQLQPVYKNPTSITISSSTESSIYFTIFLISSSVCDYVDVIIDGPTSRSYTLTDSDLSNNMQYCLLFHYMNSMTYNLYRSSSTESYDNLYYSTSCQITSSMNSVSSSKQLSSYNSIAIQINMDQSTINSGTEMGVSSTIGTNSYTGGLYSVPGYSAKLISGSGSVTSSLSPNKNYISLSSTRKIYSVRSGYLLVFPDSNSYVYGLAEVGSNSLSILGNTGIKSVYFKDAGTVTLYCNSGSRSIYVIVFDDALSITSCDEVIVANKVNFKVHSKGRITTCVYIAPVDGTIEVDPDSPITYYYASGSYNSFSGKKIFYYPIQVKISDSSEKTQFEISDDSYYSYKLLIRDGTNTNKTYSISSSFSPYNLNSYFPKDSPSSGTPIGMIVGIIVGILVIIVIIIVVCCCCCSCIKLCTRKRRYTSSSSSSSSSSSRRRNNAGGSSSPTPSGQSQPQMYQQWNQYQQQQTAPYPPPSSQQYPPPYNAPPPAANAPPPYNPPQYAPPPASNDPPPYNPPQYAAPPIAPAPPAAQDNYENPYA